MHKISFYININIFMENRRKIDIKQNEIYFIHWQNKKYREKLHKFSFFFVFKVRKYDNMAKCI